MPESEIFIVRCGRPIWSSHAGLSENSPRSCVLSDYFHHSKSTLICCGWDGKIWSSHAGFSVLQFQPDPAGSILGGPRVGAGFPQNGQKLFRLDLPAAKPKNKILDGGPVGGVVQG